MPRTRVPFATLSALMFLASPGPPARADCAAARAFFAIPEGATVPAGAEVHLFFPPHLATPRVIVSASGEGVPRVAALTPLPAPPAFRVVGVRLPDEVAGPVRLEASFAGGEVGPVRRLDVVGRARWRPPAAAARPLAIADAGAARNAWTCSHEATRRVEIDRSAPVYRVTAYDAGGRPLGTRLFPASSDAFFAASYPGGAPRLDLGHVSCLGTTWEWRGHARIAITVEAIWPGGASSPPQPRALALAPP